MNLWDLAEFEDLDYLNMYVADELGSTNFSNSVLVCPRGHSLVIPGVDAKNFLTLKIPFGKKTQRFFLALIHAYNEAGFSSNPTCHSARESLTDKEEKFDWGVLAALNQVFSFVESSCTKEVDFRDLQKLVNDQVFLEVGELGIAFKTEVKNVYSPYLYYYGRIMGEGLLSSGQLRSAGVADAIALHWRFLLDDEHWKYQCGSVILLKRLERFALLLSKCYVRPTSKYVNYQSKFWPYLLVACAGWFFRMAIVQRTSLNKSSSTLCLTRAFELALQAQSLLCSAATLEANGEIFFNGSQLEGCGKIVSLVERGMIQSQLKATDINDWVIRARTLLSVRNHSRLAHGVDDVDQDGFAEIMRSLKRLMLEFLEPQLYQEFSDTYLELALPTFKMQFNVGIKKILGDYVDYL